MWLSSHEGLAQFIADIPRSLSKWSAHVAILHWYPYSVERDEPSLFSSGSTAGTVDPS